MQTPASNPDMAALIDTNRDRMIEAFSHDLSSSLPLLGVLQFHAAMVGVFADALDRGQLGEMLAQGLAMELDEARQEAVLQTLALIRDSSNPKLAVDSLIFSSGLHGLQEGKSQIELGDENGVGRAAVSQRVTGWGKTLGLPPSRGMKDDEAQESYQARAHEQHGTQLKHASKEASLMEVAMKRMARWVERIAPMIREARDRQEAATKVQNAWRELQTAMAGILGASESLPTPL
jgi:hypothetical protein